MKFRAHESFFIRKGWLNKGLRHIENNNRVFSDRGINPMDEFGIGTNMVKSLRYWLQAVDLTEEVTEGGYRIQRRTEFGNTVWNNDRYMEENGTLCILHYKLASNYQLATAWYWFFNVFNMSEFTKEDFIESIDGFIRFEIGEIDGVATSSLEDDYSCILNTYIARKKMHPEKVTPENNIDCPLGELNLIDIVDRKKVYRKSQLRKDAIHPLIILAVILDQHHKTWDGNQTEIKISKLLSDKCNVGKIFNLDTILISHYLDKLQQAGYLKVIRTAGLDVIKLITEMSFIECLNQYYVEINGVRNNE